TSIAIQLCYQYFLTEYCPTIEASFRQQLAVDNQVDMVEILDTAGQGDFSSRLLVEQNISWGQCFVYVYSSTSRASFQAAEDFYQKTLETKGSVSGILIGNKSDLQTKEVSLIEGQKLAHKMGIPFFELTAKKKKQVFEAFGQLVREYRKTRTL